MGNPKERLEEIKDEIKELMEEAKHLVRRHADQIVYEQARSYWIPHILMALDKDHDYLGSSMFTMEDTICQMDDDEEDEESEDEEEYQRV